MSQAAQGPAGRTGSVCLAVFCYHSEANSLSPSSSPRESVAPQIPQRISSCICPSFQGQSISQFKYSQQSQLVIPEKSSLLQKREVFSVAETLQ